MRDDCPNQPILCEVCGDENVLRGQMEHHLEYYCSENDVICECGAVYKRKVSGEHSCIRYLAEIIRCKAEKADVSRLEDELDYLRRAKSQLQRAVTGQD